jgi:nicotinamidase-related amidase
MGLVKAEPYDWPYDDRIVSEKSALVLVDLQNALFSQLARLEPADRGGPSPQGMIERLRDLLKVIRELEGFSVIYTREGHRPDLSDCPLNQLWRHGGHEGVLVRGTHEWEILGVLSPRHREIVVDKPGKSAFWATDFDMILRTRGITHLILAGLFTDGAVHSTMREANDRGYECLLLEDCTATADDGNYKGALKTIKMSGGIFGAVAPSQNLVAALSSKEVLKPASFIRRGKER